MNDDSDQLEGWDFLLDTIAAAHPESGAGGGGAGAAVEPHETSWLPALPVHGCSLEERLEVAGYAVFDAAAGPVWSAAVRQEILELVTGGRLAPSLNKLAAGRDLATGEVTAGHTLPKTGVFELDVCVNGEVREAGVLEKCPCLRAFWEHDGPALAATLSRGCPRLRLTAVDTIKLQYSDGTGGCFPMHYDTSSAHSRREITAILYLNPTWKPGNGGELRLFPFPLGSTDVAPLMDRLAIFNSTEMLHRVMPAAAPRLCLSVWFAREAASEPISLPCRLPATVVDGEGADHLKFLLQPTNRRVLSKVVYSDEWAQSFEDAFGKRPEVAEALRLHSADTATAAKAVTSDVLQLVRECLPIPIPADLTTPILCAKPLEHLPPLLREPPSASGGSLSRGDTAPGVYDEAPSEAAVTNAPDVMGGTFGGVYSPRFLRIVKPLYDLHMGVESMAPLLYALIRFTKPAMVMEIGAGYTTPFMLQALKDNYDEIAQLRTLDAAGKCTIEDMPWCVKEVMTGSVPFPVLQCVDNLAHEHTTAQLVIDAALSLDTLDHLDLYFKDAYDFLDNRKGAPVDLAFLDFGQGDKIGKFVEQLWPQLRPGALVLVHSTVTNSLTRSWLESMRKSANDVTGVLGPFATLSLREPHKMFQNSFSIFQKREGFEEPILTKFP